MTSNLKDVTILIKNNKFTEALKSLKELSELEKKKSYIFLFERNFTSIFK